MSLLPYLAEQLSRHPSMRPRDLAKLCYQAARGAEHLLTEPDRARLYLEKEMEITEPCADMDLYEVISPWVARVNLAAWKSRGFSTEALFSLFLATASVRAAGEDLLPAYLEEVTAYLASGEYGVSAEEWNVFLTEYRAAGMPAVHHSEEYRLAEKPAYRIVRVELLAEYTEQT
jgi:hypothetical protein